MPTSASDPAVVCIESRGGDVVLDQNGDAMQRAAQETPAALGIQLAGDANRLGIRLDHRAEQRIQLGDPIQVELRDLLSAQAGARHRSLQLEHGRFEEVTCPRHGRIAASVLLETLL